MLWIPLRTSSIAFLMCGIWLPAEALLLDAEAGVEARRLSRQTGADLRTRLLRQLLGAHLLRAQAPTGDLVPGLVFEGLKGIQLVVRAGLVGVALQFFDAVYLRCGGVVVGLCGVITPGNAAAWTEGWWTSMS